MEVEEFLNKHTLETNPGPGMLLLSAPMMIDKFFTRSVVLLLDNGQVDTGHVGLILNHSIDVELKEIIPDLPVEDKINVFNGGPVDLNRMFVLHKLPEINGSIEVLPGLYTGGNSDQLWDYVCSGEPVKNNMRFFFGISGWGDDQLAKEILENSWAVNRNPNPQNLLEGTGDEYWRREVTELGENYRSWLSMPLHPSLN